MIINRINLNHLPVFNNAARVVPASARLVPEGKG
jgi:hypothetical protein